MSARSAAKRMQQNERATRQRVALGHFGSGGFTLTHSGLGTLRPSTSVIALIFAFLSRLLRRWWTFADHHVQIYLLVLAHEVNLRIGSGLDLRDHVQEAGRVGDVFAV